MDEGIIMSKGPILTGKTLIDATQENYVSITLNKTDWCTFKGDCNLTKITMDDLCMLCKYKKLLDIPNIINKERNK